MSANTGVWLEDLTWLEAKARFEAGVPVVIPIGAASKAHGPHLPLKTDALTAREVHDLLPTPDFAPTTVLTVLRGKGLVGRERHGRATATGCCTPRKDHTAALMHGAVDRTAERGAALIRFLGSIRPATNAAARAARPATPTNDPTDT